jgi:hypothetical protein
MGWARIIMAVAFALCAATAYADPPPPKPQPRGPYAVTLESFSTLPTHTAYYPTDLSDFGPAKKLPIVSWGNGSCFRIGAVYAELLNHIASHGYLAISVGPKFGGTTDRAPAPTDYMLTDAVDWAVKQNGDPVSPFYGKLDTTKIAMTGQSCGGLQALVASADPRVTASLIYNSGVRTDASGGPSPNSTANKASLAKLHAPIAYIIGGPSDTAYANAQDDFSRITVPVFMGNLDVGHPGTFYDDGAGWFGEVGLAWLDWRLKGDAKAAAYFTGARCTLCKSRHWQVQKKNMD